MRKLTNSVGDVLLDLNNIIVFKINYSIGKDYDTAWIYYSFIPRWDLIGSRKR